MVLLSLELGGYEISTYVKRPIEIQATQWFKAGDHPNVQFCDIIHVSENGYEEDFYIDTLEGKMRVKPGDWIVTGINGEHYPVKDDIFKRTYQHYSCKRLKD